MANSKSNRRGRGEGSVEILPSGKFRVVLSAGKNPETGERQKLTGTFDTKKEALVWRDEQLRLLRKGQVVIAGARMTVADWLRQWLKIIKPTIAKHTHLPYERDCSKVIIPKLGQLKLPEVTAAGIEQFYADLAEEGMSASMIRKAGTTLGVALQKAVKHRLIPFNPARDAEKPALPHDADEADKRAMTPAQLKQFLASALQDRLYALYVVWLDSGAREGELYGLRWVDVDFEAGAIRITNNLEEYKGQLELKAVKTAKSRRRIALGPMAIAALNDHRQRMLAEGNYRDDGPVFCDSQGGWLRKSNVQRRSFNKILSRARLPHFRPYDLRHSSATFLLHAGVNIKVVSERLGHSTTRLTLDTYSHVLPGHQEEAALRIDGILREASAS